MAGEQLPSSLLLWYNNLSSNKHTIHDLQDGQNLCSFARNYLSLKNNNDYTLLTTSTMAAPATSDNYVDNNFLILHNLLQSFVLSNEFSLQADIEPLDKNQLTELTKLSSLSKEDIVILSLELLLCCCVQHPSLASREEAINRIVQLPIENQQMLMEVIEKRLSKNNNSNNNTIHDIRTPLRAKNLNTPRNISSVSTKKSSAFSASTVQFRSSTKAPKFHWQNHHHTTTPQFNSENINNEINTPSNYNLFQQKPTTSPSMTASPQSQHSIKNTQTHLSITATTPSSSTTMESLQHTICQQSNQLTSLMSEISHLQYVLGTKRDHNIELANHLDDAHSKITHLEKDNQIKDEYKKKYLVLLDDLELCNDEKKTIHKKMIDYQEQIKRMKTLLEKRKMDGNSSNSIDLQISNNNNTILINKNSTLIQKIKVLEKNIEKRDTMHKTEMSNIRKKVHNLELLVKEKDYALEEAARNYTNQLLKSKCDRSNTSPSISSGIKKSRKGRNDVSCISSSSLSPSAPTVCRVTSSSISTSSFSSPLSMLPFTRTIHDEMNQLKTNNNIKQLNDHLRMLNEDYNSMLIETNERKEELKKKMNKEHAVAIYEQRCSHQQSVKILREEYSELQMTIATEMNTKVEHLRQEHKQLVHTLVEEYNITCDDLVQQRDEYAEEVEKLRQQLKRQKKKW
jgi:hypothetical protein